MKRINNVYSKIYSIDNIRNAHKHAKIDKSYYTAVKKINSNENYYFNKISEMLKNKTYKVSNYSKSIISDRGKDRELQKLPYYPDRIIQWAIMLQLEEVFMKSFISTTCASLPNRGIHKASKYMNKYLKELKNDKNNTIYCLKLDVKKFYPSINHDVLKKLLRRKIKDNDLLWLLDLIIDSIDGDTGIPIGSYLSQYMGNFYLSYFDHWLKEELNIKYYIRYMDDIVILHTSKDFLHDTFNKIEKYLNNNLKLKVKENWQVFPVKERGVDFVGYRFFGDYTLLRKSTCKRYKKRMKLIRIKMQNNEKLEFSEWCSAQSYTGWLKWCDSRRLSNKYHLPVKKYLNQYYLDNIKKGKNKK